VPYVVVWLDSPVSGKTSDLRSSGCGYESYPLRCRVRPWTSRSRTPASDTKQSTLK